MAQEIILPTIEDIQKVGKEIKMDVGHELAMRVLDEYAVEALDDTTSMWFELVENILYRLKD